MNGQLATKAALIYDPLAPMPRTADSIQFMEPVFNDPKIGEDGTCTVRFQVLIPDSVNPQPERKWYVNDQEWFYEWFSSNEFDNLFDVGDRINFSKGMKSVNNIAKLPLFFDDRNFRFGNLRTVGYGRAASVIQRA